MHIHQMLFEVRVKINSMMEAFNYTYAFANTLNFKQRLWVSILSYGVYLIIYDPLNNLTLSVVSFSDGSTDTRTYAYNGQQLVSVTHDISSGEAQPSLMLVYDADGNVISLLLDGNESDTAGYNALNQRTVRNVMSYSYDAYGHLCQTGNQTRFYHGSDVLVERDVTSKASIQHIVFGNQIIAQSLSDNSFAFMGIDQHGSIIASDQASDITLYTPFGEGRNGTLRRGFNGELVDNETGEYSLGNGTRFYAPELGVFMSLDSLAPFGVGDINPYRYCLGDPVNNLDPSGHMGIGAIFGDIFDIIGAVVGVIIAIPTEGALLTLTASAEIMLGAVDVAATATSIALDATGHEKGASIAGVLQV